MRRDQRWQVRFIERPKEAFHGCVRKVRYPSKKIAEAAARSLHRRGYDLLNAYHCAVCGKWHLGH